MTNYEKIKSMTINELAALLTKEFNPHFDKKLFFMKVKEWLESKA